MTPSAFLRMSSAALLLVAGSAMAQGTTVATPPDAPPSAAVTPPPAPPQLAQTGHATTPPGQWTYTAQYGWLWLPWDAAYTWVPPAGVPLMYAYSEGQGWTWLAAPWVYGVGPLPSYGRLGPERFAWYARPWFRLPVNVRVAAGPRFFEAGRPFVDYRLHLDRFRDFDRHFGRESHHAFGHPGAHAFGGGHRR